MADQRPVTSCAADDRCGLPPSRLQNGSEIPRSAPKPDCGASGYHRARRSMAKRAVVPLMLGLALVAQRAPAFQSGQPFRTGVNTVPIYATVTDNRGTVVSDLTAQDFEIQDEGHRQP